MHDNKREDMDFACTGNIYAAVGLKNVGTGDTIRHYEYDTHGSYPFGPDHWIEYREVFSYQMPDQITALGTADVDYDGLPEVDTDEGIPF